MAGRCYKAAHVESLPNLVVSDKYSMVKRLIALLVTDTAGPKSCYQRFVKLPLPSGRGSRQGGSIGQITLQLILNVFLVEEKGG